MEVTAKIVSVTFESFFKTPVLLKEAQLDTVAQKCLQAYSSYGLAATQIEVRNKDLAYNYSLSFALFNGNATFKISAEKIYLKLQNATSQADYEVVFDCVTKAYEHLPLSEINITNFSATAQATAVSKEDVKLFFSQFAKQMTFGLPENNVHQCGVITYTRCAAWPEEIRLLVDRSFVFPDDGLYFIWETTLRDKKFSRETLIALNEACNQAADKLNLVFPRDKK